MHNTGWQRDIADNAQPIGAILDVAAQVFGVERDRLTVRGDRHNQAVSWARHLACYWLQKNIKLSLPQIAKVMGYGNHTSALHAIKKVKAAIEGRADFRNVIYLAESVHSELMRRQLPRFEFDYRLLQKKEAA